MSLPLEGVKVLDLSRLLPGGFCSLLLADFGAEVLKVEDTGAGDYVRWAPPLRRRGAERAVRCSSRSTATASIRVNLKEEGGREVLLRLAREYDVLLESFRPGVLDRLGVGYERLREANPGLVYCAITGYGLDGPYTEQLRPRHELPGADRPARPDRRARRPPIQSAGQIADIGGGALMAAFGILAALRERDRSGEGQVVDVSMADGAWLAMVAARHFAEGAVPHRGDLELAGSVVCYRPYACRDGWVTLGALEPKFWQAWCRGVEREDLIEKQFEAPGSETHAEVERIFLERTREDWRAFASGTTAAWSRCSTSTRRSTRSSCGPARWWSSSTSPGAKVKQLNTPIKMSRTPGGVHAPSPVLGEHTDEVLAAAGYSAEDIAALKESGAVAGPAAEVELFMG